ncbi:hypothetical protein, partial [Legionella bononiensis]|uniref:hypothetical protein n=2 Tax=Legionella bononiensis TaxID=2793102 RepID=UPI001EE4617E
DPYPHIIVARMKHSEIREAYAQHSTFLISARFAGLPGLRASHFIQATFDLTAIDLNLRCYLMNVIKK